MNLKIWCLNTTVSYHYLRQYIGSFSFHRKGHLGWSQREGNICRHSGDIIQSVIRTMTSWDPGTKGSRNYLLCVFFLTFCNSECDILTMTETIDPLSSHVVSRLKVSTQNLTNVPSVTRQQPFSSYLFFNGRTRFWGDTPFTYRPLLSLPWTTLYIFGTKPRI